jgi:hypothetical protein
MDIDNATYLKILENDLNYLKNNFIKNAILVIKKQNINDDYVCYLFVTGNIKTYGAGNTFQFIEKYITREGESVPRIFFNGLNFNNNLKYIEKNILRLLLSKESITNMPIIFVLEEYEKWFCVNLNCNFEHNIQIITGDQVQIYNNIINLVYNEGEIRQITQITEADVDTNKETYIKILNYIIKKTLSEPKKTGKSLFSFFKPVLPVSPFKICTSQQLPKLPPINNIITYVQPPYVYGGKIRKVSYESMTKSELLKRAEKRKLECKKHMSKAEIISLLRK